MEVPFIHTDLAFEGLANWSEEATWITIFQEPTN
jgi:hypothetical protein